MNCLDKYRSKLVREINKDLRIILEKPKEDAVHDFRVGVKRLRALYYFLNEINADLRTKEILKPYRLMFKSMGSIRDGHIAAHLIAGLDEVNVEESKILVGAISSRIRKNYRLFQKYVQSNARISVRMPTVRSTGISERTILRGKRIVLNNLLHKILSAEGRMNAEKWHKKRILLKRYRHTLDAFYFCPGHRSDEDEIKQIKIIEQLLGDWHDRVITIQLLQTFQGLEAQTGLAIAIMKKQEKLLLGSAKIYLGKYTNWHEGH
jgi:CHAD domain-containing protein